MSACLFVSLQARLFLCLLACPSTVILYTCCYMSAHLPACLFACLGCPLPECLHVYQLLCLPACMCVVCCLSTCCLLSVYVLTIVCPLACLYTCCLLSVYVLTTVCLRVDYCLPTCLLVYVLSYVCLRVVYCLPTCCLLFVYLPARMCAVFCLPTDLRIPTCITYLYPTTRLYVYLARHIPACLSVIIPIYPPIFLLTYLYLPAYL